jgi:hypothetical protein
MANGNIALRSWARSFIANKGYTSIFHLNFFDQYWIFFEFGS